MTGVGHKLPCALAAGVVQMLFKFFLFLFYLTKQSSSVSDKLHIKPTSVHANYIMGLFDLFFLLKFALNDKALKKQLLSITLI